MSGFLFFAGFITLMIVLGVYHYKKEEERTKALEAAAKLLGFTFDKTVMMNYDLNTSSFKLFTTGHSRRARNIMEQKGSDLSISHFDYSYTTGSGKNQSTFNQTVTIFTSDKLKMPYFVMGPESFFHKIGELVGVKDIDFVDSPEFSKSYLLKGDDEGEIRRFFDMDLRKFFTNQVGFSIESLGSVLLVYNKAKKMMADEISAVLKERIEIYKMFLKQSAGTM